MSATALFLYYGHCKKPFASVGDNIRPCQRISTVVKAGLVTGPHLHLELRLLGAPIDLKKILTTLR